MKKEYQDVISAALGVKPILINSALVSAQNRKRLYWTNIPFLGQPDDKGILLKDILQHPVDKKYYLTEKAIAYMTRGSDIYTAGKNRFTHYFNDTENKSKTITANFHKGVPYGVVLEKAANLKRERSDEGKRIRADNMKNGIDHTPWSKRNIVKRVDGKVNCLTASQSVEHIVEIGDRWRRLTPNECEALQTVPLNYCAEAIEGQRYRMLGNGWNVDTIVHLFQGLKCDWF
jgi:site-specific DNA-cytosine methylase